MFNLFGAMFGIPSYTTFEPRYVLTQTQKLGNHPYVRSVLCYELAQLEGITVSLKGRLFMMIGSRNASEFGSDDHKRLQSTVNKLSDRLRIVRRKKAEIANILKYTK